MAKKKAPWYAEEDLLIYIAEDAKRLNISANELISRILTVYREVSSTDRNQLADALLISRLFQSLQSEEVQKAILNNLG